MIAGRLDELLTTLTPETTWTDAEPATVYVDGAPFWAHVEDQSGAEALKAGQVSAEQPVLVKARWHDVQHLTTSARLRRADGRVMEISRPARELGRRDGAEILCTYDADGGA